MDERIKKVLRTLQSELPVIKELKDGFYFHTRRLLRTPHEKDFALLRNFCPSAQECFVDVGANHGQSIESILLAQPTANIVSYEANLVLGQKLALRYQGRQNVKIVSMGLSDSVGNFTLFVPSYKGFVYDGLASLDRNAAASWINKNTVFGFDATKLTIAEVKCETVTLDGQKLRPLFIKIDVQGCEYNVLKGGIATLRQHQPVVLLEAFHSDPRTVRLAQELGYEEYNFDGARLRKGPSVHGENSFLITPQRFQRLFAEAQMAPDGALDMVSSFFAGGPR
jgi:FkbM family methyltransferase